MVPIHNGFPGPSFAATGGTTQGGLVFSLLDTSYEVYASYEYRFLTYFLGSVTLLTGSPYINKDTQNNLNPKVLDQLVLISEFD